MRIASHKLQIVAIALLVGPLVSGIAFAQRGDGRGGGGGGGGGGNRGGGGGGQSQSVQRGGGGGGGGQSRSFQGGGGGRNRGGQNNSNRGGGDFNRGGDRGGSQQQDQSRQSQSFSRSRDSQDRGQADRSGRTQQRSYYRGPDFEGSPRGDRDGSQRQYDSNRSRGDWTDQFRRDDDRSNRDNRDRDRDFDRDYDGDREARQRETREAWQRENRDDRDWYSDQNRRNRDDDRFDDRFDENRGRGDRQNDWRQRADYVRRDWRRGWDRGDLPFRYEWWNSRGIYGPAFSPYRYSWWRDRPNYWWTWTPARALTDWVVFGWNRPYYWDYGPGRNVYYRDDYVYYDDRRVMPVDDYYQNVYDLAHEIPEIDEDEAEEMEWKPLGVFALTREDENESQRALQLAVNRDGILSGTYFNRENGHVHPVTGQVDERTQRAAWAFSDGEHEDVVFETSIYNLTKDQASMMVHFGPDSSSTEVWHLVRLEQPEAMADPSGATPRPALP